MPRSDTRVIFIMLIAKYRRCHHFSGFRGMRVNPSRQYPHVPEERWSKKCLPTAAGMDLRAQLIYFYCIFEMFRIKKLF